MMTFRVRFAVKGDHVHCRLFVAPHPTGTYAKCGDFVVRRGTEFRGLRERFQAYFVGESEEDTILHAQGVG